MHCPQLLGWPWATGLRERAWSFSGPREGKGVCRLGLIVNRSCERYVGEDLFCHQADRFLIAGHDDEDYVAEPCGNHRLHSLEGILRRPHHRQLLEECGDERGEVGEFGLGRRRVLGDERGQ